MPQSRPDQEVTVSQPRPPTIRQVAGQAGVSKSLVSLVLRGSPNVSETKRAAVMAAIEDLGYRPNAAARNLTTQRTNTVGVLLNDLRNPWFVDCLDGLASVLHGSGVRMFLADARLDRAMGDSLTKGSWSFGSTAWSSSARCNRHANLKEPPPPNPTVVAASRDIALPNVDVVANDDVAGARLAVEHSSTSAIGTSPT